MGVYVDASTLIALGTVGELESLLNFEGEVVLNFEVLNELTTEPAKTNVQSLMGQNGVSSPPHRGATYDPNAREILNEDEVTGDVALITAVLSARENDQDIAIVSDDYRVRTVAEGLGATVTGTVGVVVRAVHEGMAPEEAKDLIRRVDSRGLHMTGELRETAYRLIDEAAKE